MKGIVGKKLGMTQVFDEETGVVTSVTVRDWMPAVVSVELKACTPSSAAVKV